MDHYRYSHKEQYSFDKNEKREGRVSSKKAKLEQAKLDKFNANEEKSKQFYSFDLETTGLKDKNREILRISVIKFDYNLRKYVGVYDKEFLPKYRITKSAKKKNKYSVAQLKRGNAPRFQQQDAMDIQEVLEEPSALVCFNKTHELETLKQ